MSARGGKGSGNEEGKGCWREDRGVKIRGSGGQGGDGSREA